MIWIRDWQRFWFLKIYFIIFEVWNFSSSNAFFAKMINRENFFFQEIQDPRYLSPFLWHLKTFIRHSLIALLNFCYSRCALCAGFRRGKRVKESFPFNIPMMEPIITHRWIFTNPRDTFQFRWSNSPIKLIKY